jgi:hypothetical protein
MSGNPYAGRSNGSPYPVLEMSTMTEFPTTISFSPKGLKDAKWTLRQLYPDVGSVHLTEALAAGLGFTTYAGLRSALKLSDGSPESDQIHIRCALLGKGMFPNEVALQIATVDKGSVSTLVDRSLLKIHDSEHFLRVTLMESENNACVCLLPTETESGFRWVRVQHSSVLEKNFRDLTVNKSAFDSRLVALGHSVRSKDSEQNSKHSCAIQSGLHLIVASNSNLLSTALDKAKADLFNSVVDDYQEIRWMPQPLKRFVRRSDARPIMDMESRQHSNRHSPRHEIVFVGTIQNNSMATTACMGVQLGHHVIAGIVADSIQDGFQTLCSLALGVDAEKLAHNTIGDFVIGLENDGSILLSKDSGRTITIDDESTTKLRY